MGSLKIKSIYHFNKNEIEYNVEESLKKVNEINDRIKVLNLVDCMFELKTMLENVPNETPIYIWGTEVDYIEIEVNIYPKEMNIETDVFINVEVVSPY